jgi:hypothetical protein
MILAERVMLAPRESLSEAPRARDKNLRLRICTQGCGDRRSRRCVQTGGGDPGQIFPTRVRFDSSLQENAEPESRKKPRDPARATLGAAMPHHMKA